MELTSGQKQALHAAARQAGVDDNDRRMIMRNVGGFSSCADKTITRQGFIAVMAFLEKMADGQLKGSQRDYWLSQDRAANPTDALVHRLRKEAGYIMMDDAALNAFLASPKMSSGRYTDITQCPIYWLRRCIEAVKAMAKRLPR